MENSSHGAAPFAFLLRNSLKSFTVPIFPHFIENSPHANNFKQMQPQAEELKGHEREP